MDSSFGPALLSALLPLATELMDTLCPMQNPAHSSTFKNLFEALVALAGTNKSDGHLQLARTAVGWIPRCVEVTPLAWSRDRMEREEEEALVGEGKDRSELDSRERGFAPLDNLFLYFSQLSTAAQFSGNVAEYTERRGVAGEDDLLFDEDDGAEEAGLGGSGGRAEDDDANVDESVRKFVFS